MILFIAPYPNSDIERDGMVQRVAAIDSLFAAHDRVYLSLSLRKHIMPRTYKPEPGLKVFELNTLLSFPVVLYYILIARAVYVHSVLAARHVLPAYATSKVVTDMHGVVPEEQRLCGREWVARILGVVESVVVRRSKFIVVVTDTMGEHFRKKYRLRGKEILNLPMLAMGSERFDRAKRRSRADGLTVIYSGGVQRWQNLNLMISAIDRAHGKVNFIVLTRDTDTFRRKLKLAGVENCVKIFSSPRSQMPDYYAQADMGFVLRDDNTVNQVACPTKLLEYMTYGVVPIVIQPEIGDFNRYGYAYVLFEDFMQGRFPSAERLEEMRNTNYDIIERIRKDAEETERGLPEKVAPAALGRGK